MLLKLNGVAYIRNKTNKYMKIVLKFKINLLYM